MGIDTPYFTNSLYEKTVAVYSCFDAEKRSYSTGPTPEAILTYQLAKSKSDVQKEPWLT